MSAEERSKGLTRLTTVGTFTVGRLFGDLLNTMVGGEPGNDPTLHEMLQA
jgi:hypothetical protein